MVAASASALARMLTRRSRLISQGTTLALSICFNSPLSHLTSLSPCMVSKYLLSAPSEWIPTSFEQNKSHP